MTRLENNISQEEKRTTAEDNASRKYSIVLTRRLFIEACDQAVSQAKSKARCLRVEPNPLGTGSSCEQSELLICKKGT